MITENGAFYPDKNPPTWERPELHHLFGNRWTLNATPPLLEGGSDFKVTCHEEARPGNFGVFRDGKWHYFKTMAEASDFCGDGGSFSAFEHRDSPPRMADQEETFANVSDSRWYKPKTDPVKTPSHYIDGRKYEPRLVIQDWGLCWELGNALKYIARAGRKGDEAEDLRKAIEYLKYRLEAIDNG